MSEYYKLYRKCADEADKLFHQVKERDIAIDALQSEVERLKGVLALIAVVDQGCGGNLTPTEMAASAMRQARSALEAKP